MFHFKVLTCGILWCGVMLSAVGAESNPSHVSYAKPKLVLQITVDQLRGDYMDRFAHCIGEGGFRYLLNQGVVFRDAHHEHANTETIVGHATLATGAYPSVHGMVANVWFNRVSGKLQYNIEDEKYPLLSADADVDKKTEIDSTQKVASSSGRSPRSILSSTVSDELSIATAGRAKIFGVSVKDRGAVSMAGHLGKAFWFSKQAGTFVSSSYYYKKYPQWVNDWNDQNFVEEYANRSWSLSNDRASYLYGAMDDQAWEEELGGYGRTFPHAFGPRDGKYFTTLLTLSPAGDELTLKFAKELMVKENLGSDVVTDYLSISFSSTDYVGHFFGSSSLESEENFLRLDRTIADLLAYVDQKVGLKNTLIVLSADHGSPEAQGALRHMGMDVIEVNPREWDRSAAVSALKKRFGIGEALIQKYYHPYIYLNEAVILKNGLNIAEVEDAVVDELRKFKGVYLALTSSDIERGHIADNFVSRRITHNHNQQRSGNIYIVFDPHSYVSEFGGLMVASAHGSPWQYDSFVPVIFAGHGLKPQQVYRRIQTVDVAVTMAAWLGCKAPSGSSGQCLPEVLNQKK